MAEYLEETPKVIIDYIKKGEEVPEYWKCVTDIVVTDISPEYVKSLSEVLPNVKTIDLSSARIKDPEAFRNLLKTFPNVESLDMPDIGFSPQYLEILCNAELTNLKKLSLLRCTYFRDTSSLAKLTSLEHLYMPNLNIQRDLDLSFLDNLTSLKYIYTKNKNCEK